MIKKKNGENNKNTPNGNGKKSVLKQRSKDKVGQSKNSTASLKDLEKQLKPELVLKRIYRSKKDLNDKDQSPDAEVNRSSVRPTARFSQKHNRLFNQIAANYSSKRAALEEAIELLAKANDIDFE